jgi:malonate transporter
MMLFVLNAVAPVFGLILLGYVAGRSRWLGEAAVAALNGFVVRLALPALMFRVVAEAEWARLWQPGFVAALVIGMVVTFLASVIVARHRRPDLAQTSIEGLAASYANTAFLGIPLCQAAFGDVGLAAGVLASVLTVSILFAASILLIEYDLHRDRPLGGTVKGVMRSMIRNPLISAPAAGGLWALTGLALPVPLHAFTAMLGSAATPCALVTIGLFLAFAPQGGAYRPAIIIVSLKLVLQPLVVAAMVLLLRVPAPWGGAAILLAALPTGTGPFMAAQLYGRDVGLASRVILISTLLSVITVSLLIGVIGQG